MLFGIAPFDRLTFIAAAVVLVVIAATAAAIPARWATGIDPLVALRSE
jgi:ABC-type lipoprotein release transport system permease subunit